MTERPILFSGPMVQAILAGRKTMTRRIIKPQPVPVGGPFYRPSPSTAPRTWHSVSAAGYIANIQTSRWAEGDHLWVREAWQSDVRNVGTKPILILPTEPVWFMAGGDPVRAGDLSVCATGWRPSIHMPRWASRITLRVTEVRAERLHAITEADAVAEGAEPVLVPPDGGSAPHVEGFRELWNGINGAGAWDANPWVWVVRFERVAS